MSASKDVPFRKLSLALHHRSLFDCRQYIADSLAAQLAKDAMPRRPTVREAYSMRVANAASSLAFHVDGMRLAVRVLADRRQFDLRSDQWELLVSRIQYDTENYVIRACSVTDKFLGLVDAVYDLGNEPRVLQNVNVVLQNRAIKGSSIVATYRDLERAIGDFRHDRNNVLHRGRMIDKKISELGEIGALMSLAKGMSPALVKYVRENRRQWMRQVVRQKEYEYWAVNRQVVVVLNGGLRALLLTYRLIFARQQAT